MNKWKEIKYIGVNDHRIDLFEGLYKVPDGMSYNSYVILDEKIAVMDTVELDFGEMWLENLENVLEGRKPDYLIVQHMEPDHSANIMNFIKKYPGAIIVASEKAFAMMAHFFGTGFTENRLMVSDGDLLSLGKHKLLFATAPMVHWPEVIVTYDSTDKVFFSADAFGKFGALDVNDDWVTEARRYYMGIVGKYGAQVQALLKKVSAWEIRAICPLHGPVITRELERCISLYDTWSAYRPEEKGVLIAFASIYGNTKNAVQLLGEKLKERGCKNVVLKDLSRCELSEAVADAFRLDRLVLASPTYNTALFPPVREFITWLTERNYSNRKVAFMENGSWAPIATKLMKECFAKSKNMSFTETSVRIMSALDEGSILQLDELAEELCKEDCQEVKK